MKTYNYIIEKDDLSQLFNKEYEKITESNSVLIQVFSGEIRERFEEILTFLASKFKNAKIIASSTDGEICEGKVSTLQTVVSISTFEATKLNIAYSNTGSSFNNGVELGKKLATPKTKLLIAFLDGLACNGEEFLDGIYSVAPNVKVAGGLSGDNAKFEKCYIGLQNKLYDKGVVGVVFDSDVLHVESFYNFGWNKVGRKHIVTKSDKNRVYMIDDMTAVDFYKKYLSEQVADKLPATGVEFPLIIKKDGIDVARVAVAKYKDGSLDFAGTLLEQTEVYLGIGDMKTMLSNPLKISRLAIESFFIYSCMARRHFLSNLIKEELLPFSYLAPTSGFFTYGELYTQTKPALLHLTLTAIALSESNHQIYLTKEKEQGNIPAEEKSNSVLMHILSVVTEELHKEDEKLKELKRELDAEKANMALIEEMAHIGTCELDLESGKSTWSDEIYNRHGRDRSFEAPTYLEFINMVVEEDREKLMNTQNKLSDGAIHSTEIRLRKDDGGTLVIILSAKMIFKNNKPYKIIGSSLDITDIKMKDNMITQQSKLAQMGEMINMIAHQWRQPLNAISASAIKLSMQNDMDLITNEQISQTTQFIENMAQEMSNTINNFMNFTKPANEKELIKIEKIIDDILHLMGAQLKNHNIHFSMNIEENLSLLIYRKDLEHVLINLISNSRDAFENKTIEKKIILFKAYSQDGNCFIKVIDNAGGIKTDIIERIFKPYFTTKEQSKGTGLGLYMSKKIIEENLGGDIHVKNLDNWTEFSIVLR